nr:unnamed protein product [Digitaria exilis]
MAVERDEAEVDSSMAVPWLRRSAGDDVTAQRVRDDDGWRRLLWARRGRWGQMRAPAAMQLRATGSSGRLALPTATSKRLPAAMDDATSMLM